MIRAVRAGFESGNWRIIIVDAAELVVSWLEKRFGNSCGTIDLRRSIAAIRRCVSKFVVRVRLIDSMRLAHRHNHPPSHWLRCFPRACTLLQ